LSVFKILAKEFKGSRCPAQNAVFGGGKFLIFFYKFLAKNLQVHKKQEWIM